MICRGIEALACKLAHATSGDVPSERILGRRAFRRDEGEAVWGFAQLRQQAHHVRNTHRTAATRAVRVADGLGLDGRRNGYLREGHLSNGWLYLGSGNLSRRGLLTSARLVSGNIECGVLAAVPERIRGEDELVDHPFCDARAAPIGIDEWQVGRAGDGPDDAGLIAAAPILSASIVTEPAPGLQLGWRDDVAAAAQVSVSWSGTEWRAVTPGEVWIARPPDVPGPTVLVVRDDATQRVWTVPAVDASGRMAWQPPRYDTFEDALDALLEFPVRPAEASSVEDEEVEDDRGGRGGAEAKPGDATPPRSYALHAAAELIERTAALQRTLEPALPLEPRQWSACTRRPRRLAPHPTRYRGSRSCARLRHCSPRPSRRMSRGGGATRTRSSTSFVALSRDCRERTRRSGRWRCAMPTPSSLKATSASI